MRDADLPSLEGLLVQAGLLAYPILTIFPFLFFGTVTLVKMLLPEERSAGITVAGQLPDLTGFPILPRTACGLP